MATTTKKSNFHKRFSNPKSTSVVMAWYNTTDETNLTVINDIIRVISCPQNIRLSPGMRLALAEHDEHATSTATWSVILTDGTTSFEAIKDAAIGTTATAGDIAFPGDANSLARGDDLRAFNQVIDSALWEIQIKLTAALATAATTGRWVNLEVPYYAVL